MEETAHSAYGWSLHEYGFTDCNDERLTKRGVDIGAKFLQHPQQSIPQSCGDWASTKATYRFFDNKKVKSTKMLEAHQRQMLKRAAKCRTLLYLHDTSALNLSGIKKMQGKGSIGGGTSTGLFLHPGLIVDPKGGIPVGLGSFELYARDEKTRDPEYKKKAAKLPVTEKESGRWIRAITRGAQILQDKHIVFISDRESDIFEVFREVKRVGQDAIIRTKQNRLLEEIDPRGEKHKLFDKILEGEIITTYETEVPIDHHRTRKAILTIRKATVTLLPSLRQKGQEGITVTVLNVMEENPPEEYKKEPIHWRLTTTLPVTNTEEAKTVVLWYIYRWRIERFFFTLKTGAFNVEKLQFETFERFEKALTMYAIAACRIIFTQYYEREHPLDDAATIFSMDEITMLCLKTNKDEPYRMTVHEAVVATAKLGGYLARKNDGPPGIKALWIGFQTLNNLVDGMLLGKKLQFKN